MKSMRFIKNIGIISLLGIMIGALFANCLADTYIMKTDVFSEYYLLNYLKNNTIRLDFLFRIVLIRFIPLSILFLVRHMKISTGLCIVFVLWTGFSCGLLISVELMNLGFWGILFYLAGIFPHFLFYVPSYGICLLLGMSYMEECSDKVLICGVGCLIIGILLEIYVNPVLVNELIRIMF